MKKATAIKPKATAPTSVVKELALKDIKPYWRNPRDNREAIEKVKKSIEQYGYNQLIAVDRKNVIIAGHTRYLALKELGWLKAAVLELDLDEKKAKAYRIVDNKTSEFASWTGDLFTELRELGEIEDLQAFFTEDLKEMVASTAGAKVADVTAEEVESTSTKAANRFASKYVHPEGEQCVTCPSCGEEFAIRA